MKQLITILTVAAVAASAYAAPTTKKSGVKRGSTRAESMQQAEEEETAGMSAREKQQRNWVKLTMPRTGRASTTAVAPSLPGAVFMTVNQKERRWILLEAKYENAVRQEAITFTWHVLLDMEKADKDVRNNWKDPNLPTRPSKYSYLTTSVTYVNVPGRNTMSEHGASVCLPPSFLECYGEPVVIGIEVTNKDGEIMEGGYGVVSTIKDKIDEFVPIVPGTAKDFEKQEKARKNAFWRDTKLMDSDNKDTGAKWITVRQGLQDRSKTIWGLVNPNYFELVTQ